MPSTPSGISLHRGCGTTALDIPVIGSLNGVTHGGWVDYAHDIENAGAQALELNIYLHSIRYGRQRQ
jgi:dihydroorotate dehydrogenase